MQCLASRGAHGDLPRTFQENSFVHSVSSRFLIALASLLVVAATGCSRGPVPDGAAPASAPSQARTTALSAEQVDAAISAHVDKGIEAAFATRNAKARWKGSVLHVRMDGDASRDMAGWTECRTISHLLKDGQSTVLEFPNGTLECDKVMVTD